MGKFVLEARKADGSEYVPARNNYLYALMCYLRFYEAHGVHDVNPLDTANGHD